MDKKTGYQESHFPQLTLNNEKRDGDGKILSSTMIDFFYVVVEDTRAERDEEKITFLADRKSGEFTISNVEVYFD